MDRLTLNITGLVQGVFFRMRVKDAAERLGLTGSARNNDDGSVTVVAEGDEDELSELVQLIKRGFGDTNIEVTGVRESWDRGTGDFKKFEIQ